MAELILTEEERHAETWFELPDETVGKVCKAFGARLHDMDEFDVIARTAAAHVLISTAHKLNAGEIVTEHESNGEYWRVTVELIDEPTPATE